MIFLLLVAHPVLDHESPSRCQASFVSLPAQPTLHISLPSPIIGPRLAEPTVHQTALVDDYLSTDLEITAYLYRFCM